MTKTRNEIIDDLRMASQAPLGQRSLAGTVRKGIKLLVELRADHSWDELSAAMEEVGYKVSAETLRRTVRRALPAKSSPTNTHSDALPGSNPAVEILACRPGIPYPEARAPPLCDQVETLLAKTVDSPTLRIGGSLLDNLNKLKELSR